LTHIQSESYWTNGAGFWVVTAGDISRVRVPSPWE
jgi:hypothetical protein